MEYVYCNQNKTRLFCLPAFHKQNNRGHTNLWKECRTSKCPRIKTAGSASAQPISYCSSTTCKRTMQYWPQYMLNNLRSSFFFLCIWIHWEHQCISDRLDDCRKNKTRRLQNHMITYERVNSCNSCTSFIYSRHNIFVYMYSVLWADVVSYIWYGIYHNDLCLLFESSTIPNSATVL